MRIAFLGPEFVTESSFDGGLANYLLRIALTLADRGHRIEIFTRSDRQERIRYREILIHRVIPRCRPVGLLSRFAGGHLYQTHLQLKLSWSLFRALSVRHREQPFQVVQAASFMGSGLAAALAGPVPVVSRVSSYEPYWRRHYRKPWTLDQRGCELLERIALRKSAAVYAPSDFLAGIVRREVGIPVSVIRPPVFQEAPQWDESVYRQRLAGKEYLLFVGTLGFLKGVHLIADALAELLPVLPDLHFVFVGKDSHVREATCGSMWHYVLERTHPHSNRVLHLASLPHPHLYPVVAHARGLVLPSLIDNLPNTCLEAMLCGRVVIATRGTSFEEVLEDGASGILVPPGDAGALAKAMRELWEMDPALRERMGARARAALERFSPATAGQALEAFLGQHAKE